MRPVEDADGVGSTDRAETGNRRARSLMCEGIAALTALDAPLAIYALDLNGPVAWVFGNEGQGVRPEVAASTPLSVRIPMPGATESLNVAAAVAVCC